MNKPRSDKGIKRVSDTAKLRGIRLSDVNYLKFKALGGVKWLRQLINQLGD